MSVRDPSMSGGRKETMAFVLMLKCSIWFNKLVTLPSTITTSRLLPFPSQPGLPSPPRRAIDVLSVVHEVEVLLPRSGSMRGVDLENHTVRYKKGDMK